jgi:YD repeat-containing protein
LGDGWAVGHLGSTDTFKRNGYSDRIEFTALIRIEYADGTVEEVTYTYNEQGLLSVISCANSTTTVEHNAFGDVVKEAVTENGEVVCATTYAYIYTFIVSK